MQSVRIDAGSGADVFRRKRPVSEKVGDPQLSGEADELGGAKPIDQLIGCISGRPVHDGYCAESGAV
jgi:hypothetical protein